MNLLNIARRDPVAKPWAEGEKIPWDDPAFSERMLREHLSQAHDAASRRSERIDAHVEWIQRVAMGGQGGQDGQGRQGERGGQPGRVLDLGCGPGLYTERLAALGHECRGIDFAPASIAYARQRALAAGLRCHYEQADIRIADYGAGYDLVMLLYGELNVFRPDDARRILTKARRALAPHGRLLLEAHTERAVREMGAAPRSWRSAERGLFSDDPHLVLDEHFWDDDQRVATTRYYVIDAATGAVTRHAQSVQCYSPGDYDALLAACGLTRVAAPGWPEEERSDDFVALLCAAAGAGA